MPTAMIISPHADDAAAFCGGTIAKFADQGWRIVLVRVTDDATDSVGLSVDEAIRRNADELRAAALLMGVTEIIELDYQTDTLANTSHNELRKRIVYLIRRYRPYAVFSFDPDDLGEDNMDHIVVARAVAEAFWVAQFDLHYPEHFSVGLEPFAVCEKWFYGRTVPGANHAEDITGYIETKVDALASHETMMRNQVNQLRLQLQTYGHTMGLVEDALANDLRPVLDRALKEQARQRAQHFGLGDDRYAERFRLVRFGMFEPLVRQYADPVPGAPEPPRRSSLDPD